MSESHSLRAWADFIALSLIGLLACYFFITPLALKAAVQYSDWLLNQPFDPNRVVVSSESEPYFEFAIKFTIGTCLSFEMPLALLFLIRVGALKGRKLAAMRPYVIVGCLIVGALLTTPEVVTQIAAAVPIYAIYEGSVWIGSYLERREKRFEL